MRRVAPRWALGAGALVLAHWGLGRVLAAFDPLADMIMGQVTVLPVLMLFYSVRFGLLVGLPCLVMWRVGRWGLRP